MQIALNDKLAALPAAREAAEILRKCVHCGFCNAVCPTYGLLGDELDGPRGRLYLIKQLLERGEAGAPTRLHLDRCLTCRACETTCPSGVAYGRLLDIARVLLEPQRPRGEAWLRRLLTAVLPRRRLFAPAVWLGQSLRPLLPSFLADKLPPLVKARDRRWPLAAGHRRRMLLLAGCVQPALAPEINAATARLLDRLGIAADEERKAGCCGALRHHLGDPAGLDDMRRNVDAWWPQVAAGGVEAIVVTASGCGAQVREYGHLLRDDAAYAERAARIAALCRDPSEILAAEAARLLPLLAARRQARGKLALHLPCSLQREPKLRGLIEPLLAAAGFELVAVTDSHLCCGSAGTYVLLQPALAGELRDRKLAALTAASPLLIATANIGCQTHLQAGSALSVVHWITLIDDILKEEGGA